MVRINHQGWKIRKVVDENLFSNETEFIRDSIRRNIELYKKLKAIHSLHGSAKRLKNHKEIPISDVFRAAGLEE